MRKTIEQIQDNLSFIIGKDKKGDSVIYNFKSMQHLIVVGDECYFNYIVKSLSSNNTNKILKIIFFDGESFQYKDPIKKLEMLVSEIYKRFSIFADLKVRNINEYNDITQKKLSHIIIVLRDFYFDFKNKNFEYIEKIINRGRAAGFHLLVSLYDLNKEREVKGIYSKIIIKGSELIYQNEYLENKVVKLKLCN